MRYVEPIFEEDEDISPESEGPYYPAVLAKALKERDDRRRVSVQSENINRENPSSSGYGTFIDNLNPSH